MINQPVIRTPGRITRPVRQRTTVAALAAVLLALTLDGGAPGSWCAIASDPAKGPPSEGASPSASFSGGATPSGGSERDRYIDLLRRKALADRLGTLYKTESELAAKRTAYAVLDLSERTLSFKVRGHVFKSIRLTNLEVVKGDAPFDIAELAGRAYTLQLKEGKGVETESIHLKMLTPDEAKKAGISEDAGETLSGAEQGEIVQGADTSGQGKEGGGDSDSDSTRKEKMVGVAGGAIPPDPPAKYHMGFDENLSISVAADEAPDPEAAKYSSIIQTAKRIGRWFSSAKDDAWEIRITIHLPLASGQQIFRQFLPGQRLLITS